MSEITVLSRREVAALMPAIAAQLDLVERTYIETCVNLGVGALDAAFADVILRAAHETGRDEVDVVGRQRGLERVAVTPSRTSVTFRHPVFGSTIGP
jgi:hypothetical protein